MNANADNYLPQKADANVDANNFSTASADADMNANIKTMRIIRGRGCEYSVHLYYMHTCMQVKLKNSFVGNKP